MAIFNHKIRGLIALMGSAILFGFLITSLFVYRYGPSGAYTVKNALIAPDLVEDLAYNDTNNKTGGMSRFIFEKIDFSFFNRLENHQKTVQIDTEKYRKFYNIIQNDLSLTTLPEGISEKFIPLTMGTINIVVRTESQAAWQDETKNFQTVHIAFEGEYYRIKLHEQSPQIASDQWVYFNHPGIYQKVLETFIPALP